MGKIPEVPRISEELRLIFPPQKVVVFACATQLVYNQTPIHSRNEMLSLTDMWRAAGADQSKQPAKWRETVAATVFVEYLSGNLRYTEDELFQVVRGGSEPATWAHWQIAQVLVAVSLALGTILVIVCITVMRTGQ